MARNTGENIMIREFALLGESDKELNRKVKLENGYWELFQDECLVKTLNVYEAEYINSTIKACEQAYSRLLAIGLQENHNTQKEETNV
jgi:hypothetical protein